MAGMNVIGKRIACAAAILALVLGAWACTNSVNLIAEVQKEILIASAGSVVATLSGVPAEFTRATSIDITVQGQDIVAYRYKLDSGSWSADSDVAQHITASGLSETAHTLSVLGKNNLGLWQDAANATAISWTVDTTPPATLLNITACTYSAAAGGIQVQWTPPAERVLILRSTAGISDAPAAGVSYSIGTSIGSSTVVYMGAASSFADTGAGEGMKHYCAFASDLAFNFAAAGSQLNTIGYNGIVYVNDSGDDINNTGISTSPKATIQAGVDLAYSLGIPAVHVAEGLYQKSGPVVTLKEGVSLYGGYSDTDWNTRGPTDTSTIKDTNVAAGGTFASPHHAVQAGSGITSATIVDGFTIAGATVLSEPGDIYQAGLFITGAPTIQNNVLDGGSGQALTFSGTVVVSGSSPIIQKNAIVTGKSGTNYGLYLSGSNATIRNNSIDGSSVNSNNACGILSTAGGSPLIYNNTIFGLYSNYTYGIRTNGGTPEIYNNYIDAGEPGITAYGILFENGSAPSIINNIIVDSSGSATYGIRELDNCKPSAVSYNDFASFSSPGGLYRVTAGGTYTTISALESWSSGLPFRGIACSGNTDATPVFDIAYRLVAGTPTTVSQGGVNLAGEGFTTDKDGIARTLPWSIGAYEYDN